MNRSSFVAYDKRGRATHYISKSGHRIEVTCSWSERRLGICALLIVINYALFAIDNFRDGDLSFGPIFASGIILVLSPVWWLAATTLWRRFRIDIDRDRVVLHEKTLVPFGRTTVRPLGEFLGMSTRSGFLGRSRFFFEFAPRPGWLAPTLWVSEDQFEAIRGWIWNAAKEMAEGPPVFAAQEDDRERLVIGSTDLGPGLAPWPPPPRRVPLWLRAQLVLNAWVAVWSLVLMIVAPMSAAALYATDVTSPWLFAGPRVRTTAVIEDCERSDFRASWQGYSRRIGYRFDAAGASWRSSSYDVRRCPPAGTQLPVEYPLGFPSLSRLRTMDRHPLAEDVAPLLIAIALYALAGLAASFVAAAREIRFLRRGRITLAVFEESTLVNRSYGRSFYLLIYRVLVGGRRVQTARYKDTDADKSDRAQLVLYDPLCPARRHFTGEMRAENLSAFGPLDRGSFGGTLFIGILLALALLLVVRAVRWTVLNDL